MEPIDITTHHQAVELNNMAVAEMRTAGQVMDAIVKLKTALAITKRCWSSSNDEHSSRRQRQNSTNVTCLDDFVAASTPEDLMDCDDVESSSSSPFYLCRQAIHVPTDAIGDDYISRQRLSAVIVFNLGLAHHLASELNVVDGGSTKLENDQQQITCGWIMKAAKLYELAWQLIQNQAGHQSPLFMMMVVNNMGVAYQALGEVEHAQKSFQHLLSTMLFLIDCGHGKLFLKNFHDGFFRNVSPLFLQRTNAGAA